MAAEAWCKTVNGITQENTGLIDSQDKACSSTQGYPCLEGVSHKPACYTEKASEEVWPLPVWLLDNPLFMCV